MAEIAEGQGRSWIRGPRRRASHKGPRQPPTHHRVVARARLKAAGEPSMKLVRPVREYGGYYTRNVYSRSLKRSP